ncbi:MAG TPA: TonB-dependent receptor [Pyrinomonadaceae bacterium]|nr:TonB-dependent receptor [Pyrinomonadaceae bacterium]
MPRQTSTLSPTLYFSIHIAFLAALVIGACISAQAQDTVTGAFEGTATDSQSGAPLKDAVVEIINQQTNVNISLKTDYRGRFFQALLLPGNYIVRVSMSGYATKAVIQPLRITYTGEVVPVPVALDPTPPGTSGVPTAGPNPIRAEENDIRASIITIDARRSGSFSESEFIPLPLGAVTSTRTFDELALLLPGVAPPPQTLGVVAGPGVGAGVGSAGQFSVNGLRSRGNNFTVDGSDNNDEDIGVRRQGFVALIPQSIESIQEYQVITLLAPAQFGRNIGGQVNAVSKTGGSNLHGSILGRFNSDGLNARNFFDTDNANSTAALVTESNQPVLLNGTPLLVTNKSNGKDKFTFAEGGFVVGGPIKRNHLFYFLSFEAQRIDATTEKSFIVPTIEQRGAFGSGGSGLFVNPFSGAPMSAIPASRNGSAVFNLFPLPNQAAGIYGRNTFTQQLPVDARGVMGSARLDYTTSGVRPQSIAGRYNYTDDNRVIPVTGEALFSTLRARVRTQNLSLYLNSKISGPDARTSVFNQLRMSYGRTRLVFSEVRDVENLTPSQQLPNEPFLLNGRLLLNVTEPVASGVPNTGPVRFISPIPDLDSGGLSTSVEEELGLLGQINIAGFSPLGVDVLNFPQRRVNNTYQSADDLSARTGKHAFTFGLDIRRSELNSDLPRNARPLVTFNGSPRLIFENGAFRLPTASDPNPIVLAQDLAALGAASNFFLTLNNGRTDSAIGLRYYQYNFFAQDSWRINSRLSLSYGLRYEYNTPVRETNSAIENTFNDPALNLAPGLRQFIDGRTRIYEQDRNNLAPRFGLVYSPNLVGHDRLSVVRVGYGIFYDQILGAVASQSRNVYPTYLTLNFGGLAFSNNQSRLAFFNPGQTFIATQQGLVRLQLPGTLNQYNPALPLADLFDLLNLFFPNALGATLAAKRLPMPMAHHYTVSFEQQVKKNLIVSAAYVGTTGAHLLRFTTPNLGPALTIAPSVLNTTPLLTTPGLINEPQAFGRVSVPPRPVSTIGAVNQFETTASSRFDSLQVQVRGRFAQSLQYQGSYTLSSVRDDVSDVFDLAGSFALPQNSVTFTGERGPANFDFRHRFVFNLNYDFSTLKLSDRFARLLLKNLQLSSTGRLQSGPPFTVNSTIDVNLDGNLTDRLNSTTGLVSTGDSRQPLRLTTTNTFSLLAPFGQDGQVGRNTFRAGGLVDLNLAITRSFGFAHGHTLAVKAEVFNLINRTNFGIPIRVLESAGFGTATNTVTPARRIQIALKYIF